MDELSAPTARTSEPSPSEPSPSEPSPSEPNRDRDYPVLLAQIQMLASRIAAIQEIATSINRSLHLDEILTVVGHQVKWILDFDLCTVYFYDEDGATKQSVLSSTFRHRADAEAAAAKAVPAIAQAIATGQSQLILDSWTVTPEADFRSQMTIPMISEGDTLGTINFLLRGPNGYTQDDVRIAYLLALQLTSAIRNARRFTEVQRLNAQLENTLDDLRKLQAFQDDLSGMIVHDLRTPLTLITLSLDMLDRRARRDQLGEQYTDRIEQALSATTRMIAMMEDLLKIAKLEAHELQPTLVTSDFSQWLDVRAVGYQMQAEGEDKRLQVSYAQLPLVKMDGELIGRVLDNLVSNALKYTHAGGEVRINASVISTAAGDTLCAYVCDDGPGIAAEDQARIFDKFGQVKDGEGRSIRPGTGLGLTFCRLAVQAHGGEIWVESKAGQGSRFYFTLPLLPDVRVGAN